MPRPRRCWSRSTQAATRLAHRERDPDVRQTKAEDNERRKSRKPSTRPSLRNAQRGLGINDLPVIFDLPLPLAIKRTEEFTRYVHPLLQAYCAKCHDGQYEGEFQLVPIKTRADRTPNALRANLDATLRLVDPKNLSHSVLLSSTLRPHGHGAKPRPIFPGSNDKAYKVLAEWVNHLAAPKESDDAARGDASRVQDKSDEVFAVDRNRPAPLERTKVAGADATMPLRLRLCPEAAGYASPRRAPGIPDSLRDFRREAQPGSPQEARARTQKTSRSRRRVEAGSATITPAKPAPTARMTKIPTTFQTRPSAQRKPAAAKKPAKAGHARPQAARTRPPEPQRQPAESQLIGSCQFQVVCR